MVDVNQINQIDEKFKMNLEIGINDKEKLNIVNFYIITNDLSNATILLKNIIKSSNFKIEAMCALGWISIKECTQTDWFDKVLSLSDQNMEVTINFLFLGKVW
jgi:hypothetical protein